MDIPSRLDDEGGYEALELVCQGLDAGSELPSILIALDQALTFIIQSVFCSRQTPTCLDGDALEAKEEVLLQVLFWLRLISASLLRSRDWNVPVGGFLLLK